MVQNGDEILPKVSAPEEVARTYRRQTDDRRIFDSKDRPERSIVTFGQKLCDPIGNTGHISAL